MKTISIIITSVLILVLINTTAKAQCITSGQKFGSSSKQNLSICFTARENGSAVIIMQTITGQSVAAKNVIMSKGNNTIEIGSIGTLSNGIYLAQVVVNGVVVNNLKVIKYS